MPASLVSSTLPNLPRRVRTASLTAAMMMTRAKTTATVTLMRNSHSSWASVMRTTSLVSARAKNTTSTSAVTTTAARAQAQRACLLMRASGLQPEGALDPQAPLGA